MKPSNDRCRLGAWLARRFASAPVPQTVQVASSGETLPSSSPTTFQKRPKKKNPPHPPVLLTKICNYDPPEVWTPLNDLTNLLEWVLIGKTW